MMSSSDSLSWSFEHPGICLSLQMAFKGLGVVSFTMSS